MTGGGAFSNADHLLEIREERSDRYKTWDYTNDATIKGSVGNLIGNDQSLILHSKNTGSWMNVLDTTLTGNFLGAD